MQITNNKFQISSLKLPIKALFCLFLLVIATPSVTAQAPSPTIVCPPVYGGGTICDNNSVLVDKKVKNPMNNQYINNIDSKGPFFAPGDTVSFRVSVTNTGNSTINTLTVTDSLPQYLTVTKSNGKYDSAKRQITFTIDKLAAEETKTFDFDTTIPSLDQLTSAAALFCLSNQAQVMQNKQISTDTTQICIEKTGENNISKGGITPPRVTPTPTLAPNSKGGLPVYQSPETTTNTPKTGAEGLVVPLLASLGGIGIFLKRRAK